MNIDDTLTQAFADLKIVGRIKKENLLNNLGVESNMKLYRYNKLHDLKSSNEEGIKLIVCTGYKTIRGHFNLRIYNKHLYSHGKLE